MTRTKYLLLEVSSQRAALNLGSAQPTCPYWPQWRRIRSLSRSRREDSPARSEDDQPNNVRKVSERSISSTRSSRADTLSPEIPSNDIVDVDSYGLSVLHEPAAAQVVDIIFVHGLGGASKGTWCKNYDRKLCWPKEWLPEDLGPDKVRVLTFGYNAGVSSKTKTKVNISDFAKGLLAAMKYGKDRGMRDLGIGKVPIIFVVHSMGGLVVKKAYLRGRHDKEYSGIISNVRSVLFLSTPHRGSNLAETLDRILSVCLTSYTRKAYIKELVKDSSTIEELNEDFRHQVSELQIFSFYELRSTVMKGGLSAVIVSKDSALLGYPEEKSIPLDADHHEVCKYPNKDDPNYRSVSSVLMTVISNFVDEAESAVAGKDKEILGRLQKILSVQSNPQEDHNALRDRWTPGTCEGLLRHDKVAGWMQPSASAGILWLHSGPGSGKSIKAAFLINFLESTGKSCQYWYFKHEDALKRSPNVFLRSLAYQVSRDVPSFQLALFKLAEDGAFTGKTEARQLWKMLFESTLFSLHLDKPLYWVIDAIDEAESVNAVIGLIKTIPISVPIRIIIISTENPSISTALSRAPSAVPIDSVGIENNKEDIRLFIEKEVVCLPGDAGFHSLVQEQLTARAEGNFLWVHLALQELLQIHSQEHLGQILDGMPVGMDSMYRRMVASITQLTKASDRTLSKKLLTWVTYGKRPLHMDELSYVLKPKYPSFLDLRTSVAQVCGHFVAVDPSDRVSLVHSTAQNYLRHVANLPFTLEAYTSHEELLDTCIQTLLDPRLRSRLGRGVLPPFCDYASTSWAYHLARVSADTTMTLTTIIKFFSSPSVLLWIETLALSNQLGNVIYASTTLTRYIERRRRSEAEKSPLLHRISDLKLLEVWCLDLLKVVGKFGDHLLQDPSAIYNIVPQLCPQNSALYQQFAKSTLSHVSVSGLSILEWDDLSSRLMIDSSQQASIIRCSACYLAISTTARTIIVWHTVAFEKVLTLTLDENIFSLTLNNRGNRLVSYGPRTTKVWSLPLGQEMFSVSNEPRIKPLALSFTTDEASLLMCSDTCQFSKLCLEDPTPKWERIFPGVLQDGVTVQGAFTNTPSSLTFNSDTTHVAVAYRGAPLEIWDLHSNKLINRCKRINRSGPKRKQQWSGVTYILWHPIDHEVLGLYTDGTVFKWQPLTEAHNELPEAPDSTPTDIQIAPNGSIFLTCDVNGSVKIHSYYEFYTIYQLSSEDTITALCFSPDNQRFFDIRGSYCNVWQPNVLLRSSEVQNNGIESGIRSMSSVSLVASEMWVDPSVPITCLTPNHQGDMICWGDEEGTVVLHDIKNDSKTQIATSQFGMGIERVAWSEDGRFLAFEDLGRRLVVSLLTQNHLPDTAWTVDRILDTKLNLRGGITQALILVTNEPTIIAFGQSNVQIWSLEADTAKGDCTIDISPSFYSWISNPRNPGQMFAFEPNEVHSFGMSSGFTEPAHKWTIERLPDTTEGHMSRATISCNKQYIMLESSRLDYKSRDVWILKTSSLDSASGAVVAIHIPSSVLDHVEKPLNIMGSDLFVYIDKSFWICTWRFDFKALSTSHREDSLDTLNGLHDADVRTRLGIVRFFFLPRDWVNASSLELCTVLGDGTFLCPRKGDIAVIRSAIGSEW